MKHIKYVAYLLAFAIISCNKNSTIAGKIIDQNQEITLFQGTLDSSLIYHTNFVLGGNTKKVVAIHYSNDILKSTREVPYMQNLIRTSSLDTTNVIRTYLYSSNKLSLISIPIKVGNNSSEWLNIYVYDNNFVITRLSSKVLENGNTSYRINSITDEIYYTFEVNLKGQIGHWSFIKDIPFKQVFKISNSQAKEDQNGTSDKPCASQSFNQCMNCFIVQACGSDWVCILACGAFPASCIGGAAAACVLL